ncbi:hypothetical protein [Georgenia sp. H159]|uniref:alpha/beta fold hydrolase n=1 Tax=Georgenia sp. H159 TaxID=3076115 RepID=UPI002D78DC50|nr:hypothetical protein [Georgenia sp. H159]
MPVTRSGIAYDLTAGARPAVLFLHAGVAEDVRRMQRRAFEVAEMLGDLEELELDPPALERPGEVLAPTLLLVGGHDLETTTDAAARVAAEIPDTPAMTWEDVAHLPSLEQPERFTALLRQWLRDRTDG